MSNTIIITGRIGQDPELKFTPNGKAVLSGSVADTPRKFDRDRNEWVDAGDTLWLNWSIWDHEAEALAELVVKGAKVTITGRLRARSFETRDGDKRTVTEIQADSIAVHPKRGAQPWSGSGQPRQAQPVQASDPWAGGGTDANSEPPF